MSDERSDSRPSKSARKRDLEALYKLAEQMTALSDAELRRLGVDERLRSAIDLVRPMRPSGARNRQLRHCTKFMDNTALADVCNPCLKTTKRSIANTCASCAAMQGAKRRRASRPVQVASCFATCVKRCR